MIPARKSRWFGRWFSRHAEKRLKGRFAAAYISGFDHLEEAVREGSVIVVSNHTAWWDALVALVLSSRWLRADGYALMDAKNLRRLPFFAKVGGFGVDLGDPADGARAVRYAAKLLRRPGHLVWIFPQGRERPVHLRPLGFQPGSAIVSRLAPTAKTIPIALRYEFGEEEAPAVWISVGAALRGAGDVDEARAAQEEAVSAELDRIDRALSQEGTPAEFHPRFRVQPSPWAYLAERILVAFTRSAVRDRLGRPALPESPPGDPIRRSSQ